MSEHISQAEIARHERPMRDVEKELVGKSIKNLWLKRYSVQIILHDYTQIESSESPWLTIEDTIYRYGDTDTPGFGDQLVTRIGMEVVAAGAEDGNLVWLRLSDGAVLHVPVNFDYLYPEQPRRQGSEFDWGPWKTFFSLTGGSILYCLSALCVVLGISEVLGPMLATSFSLGDTFPCIAALNGYELALLGVLLVIVLWQNVTDDAISLVVIAALFLVGSGMALSIVANDNPPAALAIGGVMFALALGKLYTLRRYVGMSISPAAFVGLGLALAWSCGAAVMLALLAVRVPMSRGGWMLASLPLIAGGVLLLLDAGRRFDDPGEAPGADKPSLRRLPMLLVFASIVLAAAGFHQYLLAYVFDTKTRLGDYLPLVNIVFFLLMLLDLNLRRKPDEFSVFMLALPAVACVFTLWVGAAFTRPSLDASLLTYPPVLMALTGGGALWLGARGRVPHLLYIAAAYALIIALTATAGGRGPADLNWVLSGALLAGGLYILGLVRRNWVTCLIAVLIAALGFSIGHRYDHVAMYLGVEPVAVFFAALGFGGLVTALAFGRTIPWGVVLAGSALLAPLLVDIFPRHDVTWRHAAVFAVAAALSMALWFRTKQWVHLLVFVPVMCWVAYRLSSQFRRESAWNYVVLGFLLLAAGAVASVVKGKRRKSGGIPARPHAPSDAEPAGK